jgi:hypothetical protein
VTSYSVCDFYRETEIINKNHVIIVKAHTNTTLNKLQKETMRLMRDKLHNVKMASFLLKHE